MDLARLGLVRDPAGVWRPASARAHVLSFPSDGHGACFEIEDDSFWFAHRNACILAALARHPFDGPLLDIGGGNGAVSAALERHALATVLLEPGEDGAHNARRRGLANVVCATLEDLALAPGTFGAAGLFDVAEHVADDAALLREVHRVLRPGGVLCTTVPAYRWLWSAEDDLAGHHRRYTSTEWRATLERAGFAVRYATYIFAALAAPVFVLRSLPYRLLRRSNDEVARGAARQHVPSPLVRRAMDAVLAPELHAIRAGRTIPIGTSCLAVAIRV